MNNGMYLPNYKEIVSLEKIANKEGSGIIFDELIGKWKFQYVWKKGTDSVDNISSSLLQVLIASLELSRSESRDDAEVFVIKNSIKFGILSIVFSGKAFLKGNRPLLYFYFKNFYVQISGFNIINKALKEVELKKMPFFSLIAIDKTKQWLCARGKGGGLAIWINS